MRIAVLCILAVWLGVGFQSVSDPFKNWRDKHRIGTRYEGLVEERAGYVALDLISFVAGFPSSVPASSSRRTRIRVLYACEKGKQVQLLARELKVLDLYRMEAFSDGRKCVQSPERYDEWSTNDVIDPRGIELKNIGLVAHLADDRLNVVPALAYLEGTTPAASQGYTAWFRADAGVAQATLYVEAMGGGGAFEVPHQNVVPSREPFRIDIPFKQLKPGHYRARLAVKSRSSNETSSLQFEFLHAPLTP